MDATSEESGRKWWTEDEDIALLVQANMDWPFLAERQQMKLWDDLPLRLQDAEKFNRVGVDGKSALRGLLYC